MNGPAERRQNNVFIVSPTDFQATLYRINDNAERTHMLRAQPTQVASHQVHSQETTATTMRHSKDLPNVIGNCNSPNMNVSCRAGRVTERRVARANVSAHIPWRNELVLRDDGRRPNIRLLREPMFSDAHSSRANTTTSTKLEHVRIRSTWAAIHPAHLHTRLWTMSRQFSAIPLKK